MDRITHIITSECEIYVTRVTQDTVRVRIAEKDSHQPHPTDFEIEGPPAYLAEAFSVLSDVLMNLDQVLQQEPS